MPPTSLDPTKPPSINQHPSKWHSHLKSYCLQALLGIIIFSAGICMISATINNAHIIFRHELLFIAVYLCTHKWGFLKSTISNNRFFLTALLLWLIWVTVISLLSPIHIWENINARQSILESLVHIIFAIIIYHFSITHNAKNWIFLGSICASTIYMAFYFIYQCHIHTWTGPQLFNDPPMHSHMRHVGYQVSTALGILLVLLPVKFRCKVRCLLIALLILASLLICFTFMLWMGGRAQFLSILGASALYGCFLKHRLEKIRPLMIQFLLIISASAFLSITMPDYGQFGFLNMFERLTASDVKDPNHLLNDYGSGRINIWIDAIQVISMHPFTGYGADAYRYMPDKFSGIVHPHNVFLQFLLQWGIIGSILFFSMLAVPFKRLYSYVHQVWKQRGSLSRAFLAAIAILLILSIQALTDGTWYHAQPCFFLAIAWAIALVEANRVTLPQLQAETTTDSALITESNTAAV